MVAKVYRRDGKVRMRMFAAAERWRHVGQNWAFGGRIAITRIPIGAKNLSPAANRLRMAAIGLPGASVPDGRDSR